MFLVLLGAQKGGLSLLTRINVLFICLFYLFVSLVKPVSQDIHVIDTPGFAVSSWLVIEGDPLSGAREPASVKRGGQTRRLVVGQWCGS